MSADSSSVLAHEEELRGIVRSRVEELLSPVIDLLAPPLKDEALETRVQRERRALEAALGLVREQELNSEDGFQQSLDEWAARESAAGVKVSWQRLGPWPEWSPPERSDILRILYEACRNARRHGKAKEVRVLLRSLGEGYSVTVEDDGGGFPNGGVTPTGAGLGTMSLRAKRLGAQFFVANRAEGGALVGWSVGLGNVNDSVEAASEVCSTEEPEVGKSLGMELHDDLCQRLAVLPLNLEVVGEMLPADEAQDWLRLKEAQDRLRKAHEKIRRWSHELIETNALGREV